MTLKIVYRPIGWFRDYENNPRINDHAVEKMAALIAEFGFRIPIAAKKDREVVDGHLRLKAARLLRTQSAEFKERFARLPMISADDLTPEQIKAFRISANKAAEFAEWDFSKLASELTALTQAGYDVALTGFGDDELKQIIDDALKPAGAVDDTPRMSLAERFGVPPFSVLNARIGWWQDRKRAWLALGIQSELGRGDTFANAPAPRDGENMTTGLLRVRAEQKAKRKANAIPGGSMEPLARARAGKQSIMKSSKANATPGGSKMPDSKNRARGDGRGRPVAG